MLRSSEALANTFPEIYESIEFSELLLISKTDFYLLMLKMEQNIKYNQLNPYYTELVMTN
jgi:diphthamide synthase subunit DPH2